MILDTRPGGGNLLVHPRCYDTKVINDPIQVGPDPQALKNARPQEKTPITVDSGFIRANTSYVTADQ